MTNPQRGEVWLADLGLAAKVRPVLVITVPYGDADYAFIGVIPHTTTARGSQFEVALNVRWLQAGAFNVQGGLAVPTAKFIRKLGALDANQLQQIELALKRWFGL
jgi:mRNA interferase MazF